MFKTDYDELLERKRLLAKGKELIRRIYTTSYGETYESAVEIMRLIDELKQKFHYSYVSEAVYCLERELEKLKRRLNKTL